jgi:hypothetical protein
MEFWRLRSHTGTHRGPTANTGYLARAVLLTSLHVVASADDRAAKLLGKMQLSEKLQMLHGDGRLCPGVSNANYTGCIAPVERLAIPALTMSACGSCASEDRPPPHLNRPRFGCFVLLICRRRAARISLSGLPWNDDRVPQRTVCRGDMYVICSPLSAVLIRNLRDDRVRRAWCMHRRSITPFAGDVSLVYEWGKAMGEEFRMKGSRVQLGPGVNLARVPQNGRNFECAPPCLRLCKVRLSERVSLLLVQGTCQGKTRFSDTPS